MDLNMEEGSASHCAPLFSQQVATTYVCHHSLTVSSASEGPSPLATSCAPYVLHLRRGPGGSSCVAAATSDGAVRFFDGAALKEKLVISDAHHSLITDINFFHACPEVIFSSSQDGSVRFWDQRVPVQAGKASPVGSIAVSPPGSVEADVFSCDINKQDLVLACGNRSAVHLYDVRTLSCSPQSAEVSNAQPMTNGRRPKKRSMPLLGRHEAHSDIVTSVRFHPQQELLVTAGDDALVNVSTISGPDPGGVWDESECPTTLETPPGNSVGGVVTSFSNEANVRSIKIIGPEADTMCVIGSTESVSVWHIGGFDQLSSSLNTVSGPAAQPAAVPPSASALFGSSSEVAPVCRSPPHSEFTHMPSADGLPAVAAAAPAPVGSLRGCAGGSRPCALDTARAIGLDEEFVRDCDFSPLVLRLRRVVDFPSYIRGAPELFSGGSSGFVVDGLYDELSERLFLLGGSVDGSLVLYHGNLQGLAPAASFLPSPSGACHIASVRAVLPLYTGATSPGRGGPCVLITGGEDGRLCAWKQKQSPTAAAGLTPAHPTTYSKTRRATQSQATSRRHEAPGANKRDQPY
eukprot:GHVT01006176.1.p1 GENE.GHVT01006176.1~~GHVT01006176.1.p1  ORF type:complete len:576 (+),score=117.66 GHVT01006176.1:3416-5143(+)